MTLPRPCPARSTETSARDVCDLPLRGRVAAWVDTPDAFVTVSRMATTKQIRVDEEVRKTLASLVRGFETPNQVLRRLLGLDKDESEGGDEVRRG